MSQSMNSSLRLLFIAVLIISIPIITYALTMPRVNVGYADSDELLTVAYNFGVAHPPGYPLYIILLALFTHLPIPFVTVAFKGHLLSLVLSAITLLISFASSFQLIRFLQKQKKLAQFFKSVEIDALVIAAITTLTVAFTGFYWQYSIITEKHALSILFVSLIVFLQIRIIILQHLKKSVPQVLWIALASILGVSLAHHPILGLLILSSAYLFYKTNQTSAASVIKLSLITILAAVISSSLIFISFLTNPTISWSFEPTVQGWWDMVSRAEFIGNVYQQGFYTNLVATNLDVNRSLFSIIEYVKLLWLHGGLLYVIAIIFSASFILNAKNRSLLLPLYLNFLVMGIGVAAYLTWPSDWGSQGIMLRQYLPGLVSLAPLMAIGFLIFICRLKSSLQVIGQKRYAHRIPLVMLTAVLILHIYQMYPQLNMRDFNLVNLRYQTILDSVKPNAIVTCYSDTSCFALLYEQYVNQRRDDVTIIPLAYPLVTATINDPVLRQFNYIDNPFLLLDIVTNNLEKRPVYAVELSDFYYQFYGIDENFMYYLPHGMYGELSRTMPTSLEEITEYPLSEAWLTVKSSTLDPYRLFLKSTAARDHLLNGSAYIRYKHRDLSLREFNLASDIFYQFSDTEKTQIDGLRTSLEQQYPDDRISLGSRVASASTWLSYIPTLIERNQLSNAYRAALAAIIVEPDNIPARLELANLYRKQGEVSFARLEYQNVLILDSSNASASAALDELSLL